MSLSADQVRQLELLAAKDLHAGALPQLVADKLAMVRAEDGDQVFNQLVVQVMAALVTVVRCEYGRTGVRDLVLLAQALNRPPETKLN